MTGSDPGASDAGDEADEDDLPDAFEAPDAPGRGRTALPTLPEFAPGVLAGEEQANACIRCGNSCRSVYLWQGDLSEFKERDTKKWVEYHEGLETFTKVMPDGKTFWGVKLDTPCKHLIETAPSEFGCAIYDRRPYVCRIYTGMNPDGPQSGCGFNRESGP